MGDTVQTENKAAKAVGGGLSSFFSNLLPIVKKLEVAEIPVLGMPVVSQLIDLVQGYIFKTIEKALALQTAFLIIDFQTEAERRAFTEAAIALRGQLDSEEANANFDKMVDRLIRYDGSYSPK